MFKKILIANRGEIAVRIVKACREMGITSVAVYSDADKNSLHVRIADQAYHIGPSNASESYLNGNNIIELAKKINADAIHPGYGFLSENSSFIEMTDKAGIKFIGPSVNSVKAMGEKTSAREIMQKSGVPIVPGTIKAIHSEKELIKIAEEIGFPIMLKAAAGGGGKGMRKVESKKELISFWEMAKSESQKAFGSDDVYIEKFIENPKHIEVQVIADEYGNYRHLFERECSVQRRHQKIIEEAPSAFVDSKTRAKITEAAIEAAKAVDYFNAGTIEFLMDAKKNFYFLEMNTRLQVEHPVTEMITGIDIVKEQIKIAAGNKISFDQKDVKINGHAIECRIYAEEAESNFSPSTGKIKYHRLPSGPGIRVDRGIELSSEVSLNYDPMLTKLIAHGFDRSEAISRMDRALGEYHISGVNTNIQMCKWVLAQKSFLKGTFDIDFISKEFFPLLPDKWKESAPKHYEIVAILLSSYLAEKESSLQPKLNSCTQGNKWGLIDE